MAPARAIHADLVTPLGAYLRLRAGARGSFLLESVERGRLGRNSFVGAGARLVDFEEAERLDAPVIGYLAYDHAAVLEPTVPLPEEGPPFAESRFVVAETLVRFDHGAGVAEVLAGDPAEIGGRLEQPVPSDPAVPPGTEAPLSGPVSLRRSPSRERYEAMVRALPGAHQGRRRLPDRPVAARRAGDLCLAARALPRAPEGQPVAVSLPARAR